MSLSQGLKVSNIVDVRTKFISNGVSLDRLNTLLMVEYSKDLPQEKFKTFYSENEILTTYGVDLIYQFAQDFFGVTSKNLTKPKQLMIYTYSKTDTSGSLKGGEAPSLADLKKLNGKFKISIDGVDKEISLDLTGGDVNSYEDAATLIQNSLRTVGSGGFSQATCIYSSVTLGFIINSGTKGKNSSLNYPTSPSSSADLSLKLGLSKNEGAKIIPGYVGSSDISLALKEVEDFNGNYYVVTPLFNLTEEELNSAGEWVNSNNDDYLFIYAWDDPRLSKTGTDVVKKLQNYNGLYIDYKIYPTQNAISSGLISSLDFTMENGNYNLNFNPFDLFEEFSVKDESVFQALKENRSNSFYTVKVKGQTSTLYGRGYVMGPKTRLANVYVGNSFLKFQQQIAGLNLFTDAGMISLRGDLDGGATITQMETVFQNAVKSGIIRAYELTSEEKNKIILNFPSNSDTVISQLKTYGFFVQISGFDQAEQAIIIKSAYLANSPANKLIINNYVLGA